MSKIVCFSLNSQDLVARLLRSVTIIITLKARYGGIEENGESKYCCDIGKVKMPLKKEDYEEIRNKLLNNKTKDMNGILAVEGELKMDEQDKWYIVEKRNNIRTQH